MYLVNYGTLYHTISYHIIFPTNLRSENEKKTRLEEGKIWKGKSEKDKTHHVGVGRCRGDRRRRRPPPRGGGCRTCNDTNTRCYRDGSAPSQSCRARQIAHVHSMFFNLSMQTVHAGPSSRLFRVRCRDPTFSCVSYKCRRR